MSTPKGQYGVRWEKDGKVYEVWYYTLRGAESCRSQALADGAERVQLLGKAAPKK